MYVPGKKNVVTDALSRIPGGKLRKEEDHDLDEFIDNELSAICVRPIAINLELARVLDDSYSNQHKAYA